MKRTLVVILALTIVVLMSLVETSAATTIHRMKVNIGFSFYVADNLLPAGEYWVEWMNIGYGSLVGSAPAIRSQDGSIFQFLPARAQGTYNNDPSCYLVFNHVKGSYFLRNVHQSTVEAWLPKSRTQKEIVMYFPKGSKEAAGTVVTVSADAQN